ncbi:MAG: hypothetical protein HFE59_10345 [Clostridiales bacterium]|nr:hypothetical protein [Clostridiales bacterium]
MLGYEFEDFNLYENTLLNNYKITKNGKVKLNQTIIANGFIETEIITRLSGNKISGKYRLNFSVISTEDTFNEKDIKFIENLGIIFTVYDKSDIKHNKLIIKINNSADIIKILKIYIEIYDENKFIAVLKTYILFSLETAYNNGNLITGYSGWNFFVGENITLFEFIGVTYNSFSTYINEMLFNSKAKKLQKKYFDIPIETAKNITSINHKNISESNINDDIKKLLTFISKNSAFLLCFAYNLLAIGSPVIRKLISDEKTERFALAICGISKRKNITAKKFANILFNSFAVNFDKLNSIDFKQNINCGKVKLNIEDFTVFRNVVMLVSGKNYTINLSNSKLQKIFELLNDDFIDFYPVFVSKKHFNVIEIEEINIETIDDFPDNKEELAVLKEIMNNVYVAYIFYLTLFCREYTDILYDENDFVFDLETKEKNLPQKINELFKEFRKIIREDDKYDVNKENIAIQLMDSITLFCMIFKVYTGKNAEIIDDFLRYSFDSMRKTALCDENTEEENISVISLFYKYIDDIFVNKKYCPIYKYWEGMEKKGSENECYYLEYNKYFDDFCKYSKINIRKSDFNSELKESDRIIMKDDKTSIGVYRIYRKSKNLKSKRLYVLAVKKV